MAPWPEQGSEPKAPDKDDKRDLVEVVSKLELEETSEIVPAARCEQTSKQPEEKEVLTLDEGQLKALLDEAITYKNPKDREGKSELFKELLQEAEADESDSKGLGSSLTGKLPRGYYNLPVRRRHSRHQGRECGVGVSTTRGGSLQNLHALGMEGSRGGRSRRSGRSGETLVSARQREGGSLPTNVNVDNDPDLDSIISPNYTSRATLDVSGTGKEESSSVEESNPLTKFPGQCLPSGTEQVPLQPGASCNSVRSIASSNPTVEDEGPQFKFASSIFPVLEGWKRLARIIKTSIIWPILLKKRIPPQLTFNCDGNLSTCVIYHPNTWKFNPSSGYNDDIWAISVKNRHLVDEDFKIMQAYTETKSSKYNNNLEYKKSLDTVVLLEQRFIEPLKNCLPPISSKTLLEEYDSSPLGSLGVPNFKNFNITSSPSYTKNKPQPAFVTALNLKPLSVRRSFFVQDPVYPEATDFHYNELVFPRTSDFYTKRKPIPNKKGQREDISSYTSHEEPQFRKKIKIPGLEKFFPELAADASKKKTAPVKKTQREEVPSCSTQEEGLATKKKRNPPSEGVDAIESGTTVYPPNPMQHVSVLSIPPPQIHGGSDEQRNSDSSEHKKLTLNRNRHKKTPMTEIVPTPVIIQPPDEEVELTSEGLLGLPLTAQWNRGYSSFTFLDFRDPTSRLATFGKDPVDSKIKSLDENGNALGCLRMDSNCLDRKKQRRVKTKNDRNVILAEHIEGFRGAADIDTLMEYIESPSNMFDGSKANKARAHQANGTRNHVKVRAKEEDSRPIKRRTKEKFHRCNSLEEISKTKLEDLTEESSNERVNSSGCNLSVKQVTRDDAQLGKKSSWHNETYLEGSNTMMKKNKDYKVDRASPENTQEAEFHVVTKKQRKKKRRSGCSGRMGSKPVYYEAQGFPAHDRTLENNGSSSLLYQYRHRGDQAGSQPRRKSASSVPPSDKSDSSDLDSVHSLPVSSTTTRTKIGKNSVSGGSTPQASYADIARTMASPPEMNYQGNICRQTKYSPYLSCSGHELEISSSNQSSEPVPTVMLPNPFASSLFKKDAMTDTTCDTIKYAPPNEEYPPLEIKTADLFIDVGVKNARVTPRDNNISEDKVIFKTVPVNFVIPGSESGDVPQSLPIDVPSSYIKSSLANSNSKRPPVILMNEPIMNPQVPTELTFGFEVNQQLLQCEESMCNHSALSSSSFIASSSTVSSPCPAIKDARMKRLIQFISLGWEETMKDLRIGRAIYYNGQYAQ